MFFVQMLDNSSDHHVSQMIKSGNPEDLQDRKDFIDVYEFVSYSRSNPDRYEVKNEAPLRKEDFGKHLGMSSKKNIAEEEKVSSKKVKSVKLSKKNKSADSRLLGERLTKLSLLDDKNNMMSKKSVEMEDSTQKIDADDIVKSDKIDILPNTSEISLLEQLKLSVPISYVHGEKNGKLIIRSKESLIEKSTGKNKILDKQGKLSVLDLRESRNRYSIKKRSKIMQTELAVKMENHKFISDKLEQKPLYNNEAGKPIVIEITHIKDNFSGESKTLTATTGSELMKQLEESINNKIVKQSGIILKNDNSGEIKLILKPESLGKVRIQLNLNDNRISGQIVVDNTSVKEIFEQNLQNLERVFKENGFDTAALNVSVGGNGAGSDDREKKGNIAKQIEIIDDIIPMMFTESENFIDLIA